MRLPDGRKSFKINRLDTILVVTDGRTDRHYRHVAVTKTALCYASRG